MDLCWASFRLSNIFTYWGRRKSKFYNFLKTICQQFNLDCCLQNIFSTIYILSEKPEIAVNKHSTLYSCQIYTQSIGSRVSGFINAKIVDFTEIRSTCGNPIQVPGPWSINIKIIGALQWVRSVVEGDELLFLSLVFQRIKTNDPSQLQLATAQQEPCGHLLISVQLEKNCQILKSKP